MNSVKTYSALFLAGLLLLMQTLYGSPELPLKDCTRTTSSEESAFVETNKLPFAFTEQRQSAHSLLEKTWRILLSPAPPVWCINNPLTFIRHTPVGNNYLERIFELTLREETPLIAFPFHYFW